MQIYSYIHTNEVPQKQKAKAECTDGKKNSRKRKSLLEGDGMNKQMEEASKDGWMDGCSDGGSGEVTRPKSRLRRRSSSGSR